MILIFLSVLYSDFKFNAFKAEELYALDMNYSFIEESEWYKVLFMGGTGSSYYDNTVKFCLSDITLGFGVKRKLLGMGLGLYPLVQFPIGTKCKQRSFSIDGYGFGIGLSIERNIFRSYVKMNGHFNTFMTEPNIKSLLVSSKLKFNPDTLTFGLDLSYERFFGKYSDISWIYITPNITYLKWKLFGLYFGVDFRITKQTEEIVELEMLGVNTGDIGSPSWKISFGVISTGMFRPMGGLFPLRIILLDEKGNPTNGLLSLADSGSFEVENGEILFELPEGIYPVAVYSENSIPADTIIVLKGNTELLLTIKSKEALGIIEGLVLNSETDNPLYANISIKNSEEKIISTDSTTGSYRAILPPGDYIVQAKADGYFPWTSLAEITEGNITILDFNLHPK